MKRNKKEINTQEDTYEHIQEYTQETQTQMSQANELFKHCNCKT